MGSSGRLRQSFLVDGSGGSLIRQIGQRYFGMDTADGPLEHSAPEPPTMSAQQLFTVDRSPGSIVNQIGQEIVGVAASQEPHGRLVLFLAADPYPRTRLRLDLEVKVVGEALRAAGQAERQSLEPCFAPTFSEFQDALLRHRPAILHWSGHGTPGGGAIFERDQQMPGETRRPSAGEALSAESIGRLLGAIEGLEIRCAVLNACFSEVQAGEIAKHADCVSGSSPKFMTPRRSSLRAVSTALWPSARASVPRSIRGRRWCARGRMRTSTA